MKKVRVELQLSLIRYSNNQTGEISLVMEDDANVHDVLEFFNLVHGEVGVVLINGKLAAEDQELPDNATVILYPVFGGG
ncbi:Molybdopterin synthase/thiamin biosynthesis sulphur carrier, beta-grasp [Moorella glycerini]|uniref:Ubiquitin Mut7-C domain-containing protein n=1 Tax=Neomoorella stamsii TaxID=1266720 RepID=A0A9X7J1Q3_9FIRM|nr:MULTISPECIES: MoaD/ThiS family protein [Moorella]PRR71512.1 hypothetical protein MOST_25680 [Moorella stamsii]CEP68723.1 Molybdopterin synthase/thiamin biosynthesis sulphur carrier, beta-grasp [Moorella glycerini]